MNVQNIGIIYSAIGEGAPVPAGTNGSSGPKESRSTDFSLQGADAKADISQTGRTLSQLDGTLAYMGQIVSKMKDQLTEIRRTLPPFKPEDSERVRILRGYIGLRQLIDELTYPPPAKTDQINEGVNLPELSDTATDQEIDQAVSSLDNTSQTLQEKRNSLGSLIGL
jgi:hypothetical protein